MSKSDWPRDSTHGDFKTGMGASYDACVSRRRMKNIRSSAWVGGVS